MAVDGTYRLPANNTLSAEVILLVEQAFRTELDDLRRVASKIRTKVSQQANYFADYSLDKFRDEFRVDLRFFLASQLRIKEIDLVIAANDIAGPMRIKYSRINASVANTIDYENIKDEILKHNTILQSFTTSNAREALSNDQQQRVLFNNGWWLGPVLCEKNPNETFLMAHVFPLLNR